MDWSRILDTLLGSGAGVVVAALVVGPLFKARLLALESRLGIRKTVAEWRLRALLGAHKRLNRAANHLHHVVSPFQLSTGDEQKDKQLRNEDARQARDSLIEFADWTYGRMPLIDDDLWKQITEINEQMQTAWQQMLLSTMAPELKTNLDAWKTVDHEVGPLLERIRSRTKQLLKEAGGER